MCNQKKTAAFEYFVSKLVGLDLKKRRLIGLVKKKPLSEREEKKLNERLSEYSMTRYMKLLYFLCLTEAKQKKKRQKERQRETERIEKLLGKWPTKLLRVLRDVDPNDYLLGTFDYFGAYLNGPIEVDIYENRLYGGVFSLFTFEEGRLKLRGENLADGAKKILEETSPAVRKAIDRALSELRNKGSKIVPNKSILEQDTISLVELSHSLNSNVWPACFYYDKLGGSISQLFQNDRTLLDAEVLEFENQLIWKA